MYYKKLNNNLVAITTVLCLGVGLNYYFSDLKSRKNERFNVAQLIKNFGYPLEIHEVTSNGYILTLHRIPHSKNASNSQTKNRTPILFVHGLLNSAAEFVNLGPGKALSLLLADKNYDVWLANVRGTTWSRKHTKLNPNKDKKAFWDFNFHHLASEDLPKIVDYVLEETNQTKLHYVGYSQGVLLFVLMASERPEYMQKIRLMTAMAPAVFFEYVKSPFFRFLRAFPSLMDKFFEFFEIYEFLPNDGLYSKILKSICHENSFFVQLCVHSTSIHHGYNSQQLNMSLLHRIHSNLPAGSSTKQIIHSKQMLVSGYPAQFDFGPERNLIEYGQIEPPPYNLSRATAPVALYYGLNDWLCQLPDVEKLVGILPNVVKTYSVPHENFNHNDFLHAIDADKLLYNSVIEEIEKY